MKLKHLLLLSSTLIASALVFSEQATAAPKNKADRWFEIEVILFSQLGDKKQLKEQFPENSALPRYRKVIDLLGPYLSPDINSLKQQLPSCDSPVYKDSLIDQAITKVKSQSYFTVKSISELALENNQESLLNEALAESLDAEKNNNSVPLNNDNISADEKNSSQQADDADSFYNNNSLSNEGTVAEQQTIDNEVQIEPTELQGLSVEQLAYIERARVEFSTIQFTYNSLINENSPLFTSPLCTISPAEFTQYNEKGTYVDYNSFPIEKVPSKINNSEDIYSEKDYLLSEESLQLNDIVKQLSRSKNFKPLLHIGWRQITKTKRLAVPMKFYAGDNFAYNYQQELAQYQQEQLEAQAQEDNLQQAIFNAGTDNIVSDITPELSSEELKQQVLADRLQTIITKMDSLPKDTQGLLQEIDNDITTTNLALKSINLLENPPTKPPQDWSIEGFFKVEVDHFLHITTDLNIMNMSLAELATQALLPESSTQEKTALTTVNFKQDRRVRSKEIHYFDHPYIGMIVRILPFKKPVKEVDDTDSLVNN
jgi:hypothetical protein